MSLPPWAILRAKQNKTEAPAGSSGIEVTTAWVPPQYLMLEKHVRYYRDLMKSTEKVELSLAHSGKEEVFDTFDDPIEPVRAAMPERVLTVLVPVRSELDPRIPYVDKLCIRSYPEYSNPSHLRDLLLNRAAAQISAGSKSASPLGSPRATSVPLPSGPFRPPPPPGSKPPPPPLESVKKARLMN